MSADGKIGCKALGLSLCCGLFVTSGITLAEDEEQPDLEFLEYLGSWESSDEDWLIFTEAEETEKESKEDRNDDPSPDGEKLAEANDEN